MALLDNVVRWRLYSIWKQTTFISFQTLVYYVVFACFSSFRSVMVVTATFRPARSAYWPLSLVKTWPGIRPASSVPHVPNYWLTWPTAFTRSSSTANDITLNSSSHAVPPAMRWVSFTYCSFSPLDVVHIQTRCSLQHDRLCTNPAHTFLPRSCCWTGHAFLLIFDAMFALFFITRVCPRFQTGWLKRYRRSCRKTSRHVGIGFGLHRVTSGTNSHLSALGTGWSTLKKNERRGREEDIFFSTTLSTRQGPFVLFFDARLVY